jgi:hypothetical protein
MRIIEYKNLYGYPAYSVKLRNFAKKKGYRIVCSILNLEEAGPFDGITIACAGLPFLLSAKIPIIGYSVNGLGVWTRNPSLPASLKENVVKLHIPKFHKHPSSDTLASFYKTGVVQDMPPKFSSYHTQECLNDRVFRSKHKEVR